MKNLMIFGLVCFVIYIYLLWIVIKEKRIIHIKKMNSGELFLFLLNYILLIIGFVLLGTGLHKNQQIIKEYKQNVFLYKTK